MINNIYDEIKTNKGDENMGIRRMRTINEAYDEVVKMDKNTAVTKYFIRQLCKQNKVRNFVNGTRVLLDLDDLVREINSLVING